MLQQPSDFIMYQKLPLDLNVHTAAEVNNLQPDFRDISLQLQAQRAGAASQAFFFDPYSVQKAAGPQVAPLVAGIQGMYDLPIHAMYNHPVQAIYDPVHHHHHHHQQQLLLHQQQQQRQHPQSHHPPFVPMSSTTSWQPPPPPPPPQQQQDSRGSWFSNWQEVFHGFAFGKDGVAQEKQSIAPSFEQKFPLQPGNIVAPPIAATEAMMTNAGDVQQPSLHADALQQLGPFPVSSNSSQSELAATLLPSSNPGVEKKQDGNIAVSTPISTAGVLASDGDIRQVRMDPDWTHLTDPSPPLPSLSERTQSADPSPPLPSSTARLPCPALEPEKGRENSLVPCTDLKDPQLLPQFDGITSKYTTQSPSWLPQGWITEVQTRRTGSTAGTRDKYYKDLVSGRRFRSRNEVIHFLQTGKGRLRKRRRKRAIASSAFGGHYNLLPHQPRSLAQDSTSSPCLFLAPQPIGFLLGPLVNPHPVLPAGSNPPLAPGSVVEEVNAPCEPLGTQPTTSGMPGFMLGLKQPTDPRPQKLPIEKKAKILSPRKCEDKQASRLWQWLQKPARTAEQSGRENADKHGDNDGKDAEDEGVERRIAERTAHLGKEIETAQETIMRLGKEMQATVEKLTRGIQTAQRDLRHEMQDVTHASDGAMSNVVEAAHRLDGAMDNVTQATQNLVMAMDLAVQATQMSASKVGPASQPKQPQGTAASVISIVSDMKTMDSFPRANAGYGAERPDMVMGYSTHAAAELQEVRKAPMPDVVMVCPATRGCAAQEAERADLSMGYFVQAHRMRNGMMGYSAEAAQWPPDHASSGIRQPVQLPDITMHYKIQGAQVPEGAICMPATAHRGPLIVMRSPWTPAAQSSDSAAGIADICSTPPLQTGEPSKDTRLLTNKNFTLLMPKLDLSMLSPSLTSRQRAKLVQRMKAKHYRRLLVLLGRKLCFKALHRML